jgi:hypothetical protein
VVLEVLEYLLPVSAGTSVLPNEIPVVELHFNQYIGVVFGL